MAATVFIHKFPVERWSGNGRCSQRTGSKRSIWAATMYMNISLIPIRPVNVVEMVRLLGRDRELTWFSAHDSKISKVRDAGDLS